MKGPVFLQTDYPLPKSDQCVIVDIDGTLADVRHREHYLDKRPRDWKSFFAEMGSDPLFEEVAFLLHAVWRGKLGVDIVLATARPSNYDAMTVGWLRFNDVPYHHIVMRRAGDSRDDAIVKGEMCDAIQKHYKKIVLVIDDRPEVVKMWRARGLKVLQPDATRWERPGA